jgi:mannosyltransferase OCH1-like enzyme
MQKIPPNIHYFWFGKNKKSPLVKRCIRSWDENLNHYKVTQWNEDSYNIQKNRFTRKAYREKQWAFLSDYARLDVLYEHGGIYLDTDMEIIKPLDKFMTHDLFLGFESEQHVNASIIGCKKNHWLIKECLDEYENMNEYVTIPKIITNVLQRHFTLDKKMILESGVAIYPPEYFYPLPFDKKFNPAMITHNTHTIHWWNFSWASPSSQILKKLGLLHFLVRIKKNLHE